MSEPQPTVLAAQLSKSYRLWTHPEAPLKGMLWSTLAAVAPAGSRLRASALRHCAAHGRELEALHGVGFEVYPGECFGIIGRNGAGKSTLLQILAGTLQPTTGHCRVSGRVLALLELGSGFNPEFTGRENVLLTAAVLGLPRAEIEARLADIVSFSEIGDFIDQPVKTYSSGMLMRLAFSVSTAVQPEVLIVDEALSVGDVFFQQKCFTRLREMIARGMTFVVVTHDTAVVANICQRALWLDRGRVRQIGPAESVVRAYLAAAGPGISGAPQDSAPAAAGAAPSSPPLDLSGCERLGNQQAEILSAWLEAGPGVPGAIVQPGAPLTLTLLIHARHGLREVSAGVELRDRLGQVLFATGLRAKGQLIPSMEAGERRWVRLEFPCALAPGEYTLDAGCGDSSEEDNSWDRLARLARIRVADSASGERIHGLFHLPCQITVSEPCPPR